MLSPRRRRNGEKLLSQLVPNDLPASDCTVDIRTHTTCTLMTVLVDLLPECDGWRDVRRWKTRVATSFRPCLACALLFTALFQEAVTLFGAQAWFEFPSPDIHDATTWFMPKVTNSTHQRALMDAFNEMCKKQITFWGVDTERAEVWSEMRKLEQQSRDVPGNIEDDDPGDGLSFSGEEFKSVDPGLAVYGKAE